MRRKIAILGQYIVIVMVATTRGVISVSASADVENKMQDTGYTTKKR